jgi:Domain of unknown function (DUF4296)
MKQLLFFLLLGCGVACSSPNKMPDDVISINQMKPIVWDMIRAGVLTQTQFKSDSVMRKKETKATYDQVFKIYGVTKDEFYTSYQYYMKHPDKHKILMDSVVAYANRKRIDLFNKPQQ